MYGLTSARTEGDVPVQNRRRKEDQRRKYVVEKRDVESQSEFKKGIKRKRTTTTVELPLPHKRAISFVAVSNTTTSSGASRPQTDLRNMRGYDFYRIRMAGVITNAHL